MDWKLLSLVGVGSAIGGIARYGLAGWATRGDFPLGTLLVNVLGCFAIGVLMFGGLAGGWLDPTGRALLGIGLLGGFTTMSSFTYETTALVEDGAFRQAGLNLGATIGASLVATWLGRWIGLAVWSGGA